MNIFIITVLVVFLLLLTLFIVTYWALMVVGIMVTRVPFVGTQYVAVDAVLIELGMNKDSVLYELGSGDGRVIEAAVRATGCRAIGYEIAPLPFFISRIRLWNLKKRVQVYPKSFFDSDFAGVTHVFTYLGDSMMARLEPLFDKKLPAGTIVVSCDYQFKNKTPLKVVDIPHGGVLSRKLFVYKW
jgi:hypothetical protein